MRIYSPKPVKFNPEEWHRRFVVWPVRIGDYIVCCEYVEARFFVIDEGNWAGGFECEMQYRWCDHMAPVERYMSAQTVDHHAV